MSRSSSAQVEKKNVRYFSDIISHTHDSLKSLHSAIGNKPLEMTLMNREFELGDQKRGIYESGEKQHPVQALENFMRDIHDLEETSLSLDGPLSTANKPKKVATQKPANPKQVADAKQLKKVVLFLLHCYVRIFMMQAKKDLAEPHTINTVSMIEDSEILPQVWQSEMDAEMKAFAREKGFDVRSRIFKESRSLLGRLFTSAELDKLNNRWKDIIFGKINFKNDNRKKDDHKTTENTNNSSNNDNSSSSSSSSAVQTSLDPVTKPLSTQAKARHNCDDTSSDSSATKSEEEDGNEEEEEEDEEYEEDDEWIETLKRPASVGKRVRTSRPSMAIASRRKRVRCSEDSDLDSLYSSEEKHKPSETLKTEDTQLEADDGNMDIATNSDFDANACAQDGEEGVKPVDTAKSSNNTTADSSSSSHVLASPPPVRLKKRYVCPSSSEEEDEEEDKKVSQKESISKRVHPNGPSTEAADNNKRTREEEEKNIDDHHAVEMKGRYEKAAQLKTSEMNKESNSDGSRISDSNNIINNNNNNNNKIVSSRASAHADAESSNRETTPTEPEKSSEDLSDCAPLLSSVRSLASLSAAPSKIDKDKVTLTLSREQWAAVKRGVDVLHEALREML